MHVSRVHSVGQGTRKHDNADKQQSMSIEHRTRLPEPYLLLWVRVVLRWVGCVPAETKGERWSLENRVA